MIANRDGLFLNEQLNGFEAKTLDPTIVLYQQFLAQLRLPTEKLSYYQLPNGTKKLLLSYNDEMEMMDELLFQFLDHKTFTAPANLYTFYLLQQYLGFTDFFNRIGVFRDKKNRFCYLNDGFDSAQMKNNAFTKNALSHFVLKNLPKKALQLKHDSFFVLLDNKLKIKLTNALIVFQSETGQKVEKDKLIATVLNTDRLVQLELWSKKLIY